MRLEKRSCNPLVFHNARQQLLSKWNNHFMSSACNSIKEHIFGIHNRPSKLHNPDLVFWLVLPYYRGFDYSLVKSSLANVMELWSRTLANILGAKPVLRISFKNASGNLESSSLKVG